MFSLRSCIVSADFVAADNVKFRDATSRDGGAGNENRLHAFECGPNKAKPPAVLFCVASAMILPQ
eukprot:6022325-Karenia_brevis.AAC.1